MKKERVDVLAVQQGLFSSREQAKRGIMAGIVYDDQEVRYDKPGEKISTETQLYCKGQPLPYVSRGGLKLEKALKTFQISVQDACVLDIGASTGGFTDVVLQHGAKQSYAVDVGYNQLAWKLRQDPRVVVMERMNFRYATAEDFKACQPSFVTIDVSFISLKLILPVLFRVCAKQGSGVALIKPQFEAGKEYVGKKGIVRDSNVHERVLLDLLFFMQQEGFFIKGLSFSPITGGEGNIEFLVYFSWGDASESIQDLSSLILDTVQQAHQTLLH